MSVLVSHPTGNANSRAVLRALQGVGALSEFWTTIGFPAPFAQAPWLAQSIQRKLSQRSFPEVPWRKMRLRPWLEATRLFARTTSFQALTKHEAGIASVDGVYRDLDQAVARHLRHGHCSSRAVYAYEDGAFESFLAARDTGRQCVYDLPIAHWRTLRRLLEEEAERHPEWACTMEGLRDSAEKHARKDEEVAFADHIVVAVSYTHLTLPTKRIV